jgi:hypothetical protein
MLNFVPGNFARYGYLSSEEMEEYVAVMMLEINMKIIIDKH